MPPDLSGEGLASTALSPRADLTVVTSLGGEHILLLRHHVWKETLHSHSWGLSCLGTCLLLGSLVFGRLQKCHRCFWKESTYAVGDVGEGTEEMRVQLGEPCVTMVSCSSHTLSSNLNRGSQTLTDYCRRGRPCGLPPVTSQMWWYLSGTCLLGKWTARRRTYCSSLSFIIRDRNPTSCPWHLVQYCTGNG